MKTGIISLATAFVMFFTYGNISGEWAEAPSTVEVLNEISSCILSQDADRLSSYFNDWVEISVDGESKEFAKGQARFVLSDFLADYPPQDMSFSHEGGSKESLYALGTYQTQSGSVFDVDLYMRMIDGSFVIDQMHFIAK